MKVYPIYTTDVWHTHKSKELIGIATSVTEVIKICKNFARKEGAIISADDLYNLKHLKQSQGYEGANAGEFVYEEIEANVLL